MTVPWQPAGDGDPEWTVVVRYSVIRQGHGPWQPAGHGAAEWTVVVKYSVTCP